MDNQRKWGAMRLAKKKGSISFEIPSCIAVRQYLLRAELIALHDASSYPGAQFYMECAQMSIQGEGIKQPATVNFPRAYKPTDPGTKVNVSSSGSYKP